MGKRVSELRQTNVERYSESQNLGCQVLQPGSQKHRNLGSKGASNYFSEQKVAPGAAPGEHIPGPGTFPEHVPGAPSMVFRKKSGGSGRLSYRAVRRMSSTSTQSKMAGILTSHEAMIRSNSLRAMRRNDDEGSSYQSEGI